jgi:RNA polymerase sigma-70 factor (ECF subfamily)
MMESFLLEKWRAILSCPARRGRLPFRCLVRRTPDTRHIEKSRGDGHEKSGNASTMNDSFTDLMQRVAAGNEDAATDLFQRYARRLVALAASRLDPLTRQKIDPEDVAQSVWKSFFLRHGEGEFVLAGWSDLWTLLAVVTVRKCATRAAYFRTARRNVSREAVPVADATDDGWKLESDEPSPVETAILTEAVQTLLAELHPRDRDVLVLSLQGLSVTETAERIGRAERTVRRIMEEVRERLESMLA